MFGALGGFQAVLVKPIPSRAPLPHGTSVLQTRPCILSILLPAQSQREGRTALESLLMDELSQICEGSISGRADCGTVIVSLIRVRPLLCFPFWRGLRAADWLLLILLSHPFLHRESERCPFWGSGFGAQVEKGSPISPKLL